MTDDLISRSRLLRDPYFREDRYPVSHHLRMAIMEQPAVDLEEVFKSLPYVKEALAKQTVAPVRAGRWDMVNGAGMVHCSACDNWAHKKTAISFYDYCPNCSACMVGGEDAARSEPLAGFPADADLEHMTRFAMQQAIKQK